MNDFFQSKFVSDLKNGELPEVKIVITENTLFSLFAGAFFVSVAVLIVANILRKIGK